MAKNLKKKKAKAPKSVELKLPDGTIAALPPTPVPAEPAPTPEEEINRRERELAMLYDWVGGLSYAEISDKHKVHKNTVYKVSKRNNWQKLRARYNKEMHQRAIQLAVKQKVVVAKMIDDDLSLLGEDMRKTSRQLKADERSHLRAVYEMHNKETRLEAGLPTDTVSNTGVIEHRIHITGGPRSSISISPPPNLTTIEEKEGEPKPVDVDVVEDEVFD